MAYFKALSGKLFSRIAEKTINLIKVCASVEIQIVTTPIKFRSFAF